MLCNHTGKPFAIRTVAGSNPTLLVLKEQINDAKSAIIDSGAPFAIDPAGTHLDGVRFCVVYFRPDANTAAIEAALAKA